jgi:hypothetical protein
MVTELYTQDVDSHDHVPMVAPTWAGICASMGVSTTTLRQDVLEAYEQARDQHAYYESLLVEPAFTEEMAQAA